MGKPLHIFNIRIVIELPLIDIHDKIKIEGDCYEEERFYINRTTSSYHYFRRNNVDSDT